MKIVCFSDTHGNHEDLFIPTADILIFCGDCSNSFDIITNEIECRKFLDWYSKLYVKHKLFIPGNHDRAIEHKWILSSEYPEINFFFNETKEIEGCKIFGSPYTPSYAKWSYMYDRGKAKKYWDCIDKGVDIVFTHGPPKGILDLSDDIEDRNKIVQVGCSYLRKKIKETYPFVHLFGHIHSSKRFNNWGIYDDGITKYVNCSITRNDNLLNDVVSLRI